MTNRKMYSKLLVVLIILCSSISELSAQGVIRGDHRIDTLANSYAAASDVKNKKPSVSVEAGTSFSSFGAGNSAIGTYVAPKVSMPVSDKLSISVGIGYSMMFLNGNPGAGVPSVSNSYANLFVSGAYQVNENLVIRGTAYKSTLLNPPSTSRELNPQYLDFSNQGFILDAEYKVNERFRIGVSVEYRDSNQPSFCPSGGNSFNGANNFGASPFQPSSFGNNW